MHDNDILNNLSRLKWACRRGMLELDVLLGNFLQESYPSLPLENKQAFVKLLNFPDPDLIAWLVGGEHPEDRDLNNIIRLIQQHARSRISSATL